jgi:hypothetical protein
MLQFVGRHRIELVWLLLLVVLTLLTPTRAFTEPPREYGSFGYEPNDGCDGEPVNCFVSQ